MNNLFEAIQLRLRKVFCGHQKATEWKASYLLNKYGEEALAKFDSIVQKHNKNYALFYGSLLGAVREQGFIKKDDDIDLIMIDKDITVELVNDMINSGFYFLWAVVENHYNGFHIAFTYKCMKFDIYSAKLFETNQEMRVFGPIYFQNNPKLTHHLGRFSVETIHYPYKGVTTQVGVSPFNV